MVFHEGTLVKKILETSKDIISKVSQYNFKDILNSKHEEAFKLNVKYSNGIQLIRRGEKLHAGYFD